MVYYIPLLFNVDDFFFLTTHKTISRSSYVFINYKPLSIFNYYGTTIDKIKILNITKIIIMKLLILCINILLDKVDVKLLKDEQHVFIVLLKRKNVIGLILASPLGERVVDTTWCHVITICDFCFGDNDIIIFVLVIRMIIVSDYNKISDYINYIIALVKYSVKKTAKLTKYNQIVHNNTNSERSDECIDFTMKCVFFFVFVSVYSITSRNNVSISNFGEVLRKHFPTFFKKIEKNKKKVTKKREFLRKTNFQPNRFFYGRNSKTIHSYGFSNFYKIYRKRENLQVILKLKNHKIFCDSISFPSSIYRENLKYHYRKNVKYLKISPFLISYSYSDLKIIRIHRHNLILTKIRQNHEYLKIILPLKHKPPFSPTTGNYILG
ncbi:hypothetical protein AGLY_005062 [Aphis glycines]|uniref:Uncharacterized protein n=1 Tax=Aphis glycines TaxID=307491 RepID=A0A6G0TW52_APHGL|nr:hypothetical protein AGLY_005062 [Aphis glycines]